MSVIGANIKKYHSRKGLTQTDARDFLMGFFRTKPLFSTQG